MQTVLSTKRLEPHQKQLLLNSGIALVEYDAIKINFLNFEVAAKIENGVITSKNAAKAIIKKQLEIENCFCVGNKTSELLRNKGYNIKEIADCGKELAEIITAEYPEKDFFFFCGNLRREEMPFMLKENNIELQEIEVYQTLPNLRRFEQEFEGILFFSPSGLKSFTAQNRIGSATAFCIGPTTASEVGKHTHNIIVATKPSIENVIVQVVKKFKQ